MSTETKETPVSALNSGLEKPLEVRSEGTIHGGSEAARRITEIQGKIYAARQFPRQFEVVRERLLAECRRPWFADAGWYRKPVGNGLEGPSIRFIEAAIRAMGNITHETQVMHDDEEFRVVRVTVTDWETNIAGSREITVSKVVERSSSHGRKVIGTRRNSKNQTTYLIPGTEDEIMGKVNSAASKALRAEALRMIPGDLIDQARMVMIETLNADVNNDPAAARSAMIEAFASIGVREEDLSEFLGFSVANIPSARIVELRQTYRSITERQATWAEIMADVRARRGESVEPPSEGPPSAPKSPPAASTPPKGDAPQMDDLTAEIEDLLRLTAASESIPELNNLAQRIASLPASDRAAVEGPWKARKQELLG